MCASWKKNAKPQVLLDDLKGKLSLSPTFPSTKIGYSDVRAAFRVQALTGLLNFRQSTHAAAIPQIVTEALIRCVKKQTFDAVGVEQEVSSAERNYNRRMTTKYVLVSRFSLLRPVPFTTFDLGHRIYITKSLPSRFDISFWKRQKAIPVEILPDDHAFVRVHVQAKSPTEAGTKGIEALALLSGICNSCYSPGPLPAHLSLYERHLIAFQFGPLYTLHFPNGALAEDQGLYEAFYAGPTKPIEMRKDDDTEPKDALRASIRRFSRAIGNDDSRTFLRQALIQYAYALAQPDRDMALILLWSVMEKLLFKPLGERYDQMITRLLSFVEISNKRIIEMELQHIRELRNTIVHDAISGDESRSAVNTMRFLIESLVFVHLEPYVLRLTHAQLVAFMRAPGDRSVIEDHAKALRARTLYWSMRNS